MLANDPCCTDVSPDVFNKLGHLHLLLGEFSDGKTNLLNSLIRHFFIPALSAYQHYAKATPELAQVCLLVAVG